jgi:predicted amidohydrolase YtcJ
MKSLLPVCFLFAFSFVSFSCKNKKTVDSIFYNAKIYTVDHDSTIAEALAVSDGRIAAVGTKDDLLELYEAKNLVDLEGRIVFPGFIDAHCHFYGYGTNLTQAMLMGTKSWEEVLDTVKYMLQSARKDGSWARLGSE